MTLYLKSHGTWSIQAVKQKHYISRNLPLLPCHDWWMDFEWIFTSLFGWSVTLSFWLFKCKEHTGISVMHSLNPHHGLFIQVRMPWGVFNILSKDASLKSKNFWFNLVNSAFNRFFTTIMYADDSRHKGLLAIQLFLHCKGIYIYIMKGGRVALNDILHIFLLAW